VGAALNLPVLNGVCASSATRDNVAPLNAAAARAFAPVFEVTMLSMSKSNLNLHAVRFAFAVVHGPMQNVVDRPRESAVAKQVHPVPKHLPNG